MTISERALDLAIVMTRAWTRLYTAGLPPVARHRRCSEIDADIWCLIDDSASARIRAGETAVQVLARCVLGLADDLAWRIDEAPACTRTSRLRWTSAVLAGALAIGVWLFVITRIELPPPPRMMTFVEAPPPPPPPPPPPRDLR